MTYTRNPILRFSHNWNVELTSRVDHTNSAKTESAQKRNPTLDTVNQDVHGKQEDIQVVQARETKLVDSDWQESVIPRLLGNRYSTKLRYLRGYQTVRYSTVGSPVFGRGPSDCTSKSVLAQTGLIGVPHPERRPNRTEYNPQIVTTRHTPKWTPEEK